MRGWECVSWINHRNRASSWTHTKPCYWWASFSVFFFPSTQFVIMPISPPGATTTPPSQQQPLWPLALTQTVCPAWLKLWNTPSTTCRCVRACLYLCLSLPRIQSHQPFTTPTPTPAHPITPFVQVNILSTQTPDAPTTSYYGYQFGGLRRYTQVFTSAAQTDYAYGLSLTPWADYCDSPHPAAFGTIPPSLMNCDLATACNAAGSASLNYCVVCCVMGLMALIGLVFRGTCV